MEAEETRPAMDLDHYPGPLNCLVNLSYSAPKLGGMRTINGPSWFTQPASILQDGTTAVRFYGSFSLATSWGKIEPAELTRARTLVAKLPPSDWWIDPRSAVVVGSLQGMHWEVRTYDLSRLPAEVRELVKLAGLPDLE